MTRPRRPGPLCLLVASQVSLTALLAGCVVLAPGVVLAADEGGVSGYGVRSATVVPYSLAFSSGAVLLWLAARALPVSLGCRRTLGLAFRAAAAGFVAVLASTYPYRTSPAFEDVHLAVAVVLFAIELTTVTWLAFVVSRRRALEALWLVWVGGSVLAVVTLAGALHVLFTAQACMTVAFALVAITATKDLLQAGESAPVREAKA